MNQSMSRVGPYVVERELGRGGMGVVYRARDSRLGRAVAIKALPEHLAQDAERLARFEREARTLASLSHPNIAGIHGLEVHDGRRYLVLELVEGESLSKRLERGPLPVDEALEVCAQIAAGLEAAHGAGVVHRDLKPGNVMLTPEGRAKVLDFGLAKASEQGASSSTGSSENQTLSTPARGANPTVPGAILGTVPYMSPEQARGRKVDKRTDVWSFGCILYECLTGMGPFAGESASDSIGAILHKDLDYSLLPAETPVRVRELLKRMLERDREKRLRDLGDAMLELQAARHEKGPVVGAATPRTKRGWGLAVGLGAAMLALGVAGGFLIRPERPVPLATTPPTPAPESAAPRFRLEQATDLLGFETHPALSPDGSTVVYMSRQRGNWDLFSQRVGGFNAINLTPEGEWDDSAPAFSPDGSQIAFRSERDGGGIFVMGATGESPRRVTDDGFDPQWSPDGKSLVYAGEGITDPMSRNRLSALTTVRVSDGEKRKLFDGDAAQPVWSPSGKRIAFWGLSGSGGQRDLYTVAAEGGTAAPLWEDAPTDWNPVWSPDGRWLFFCSDRAGNMGLWRVGIDEDAGTARGAPEPVMTAPGVDCGFLSRSSDGRRLALSAATVTSRIYRLDLDPQTMTAKPPARSLTPFTTSANQSHISPDGQLVAYYQASGGQEDLFIVRSDGTGRRRITSDSFKDRGPVWVDGGREIVFYSDRGGEYALWAIRPDGGQLRPFLRSEGALTLPRFSPDGKRLLAIDRNEGARLIELGGAAPEIKDFPNPLQGEFRVHPFAWSPDGRKVLIYVFRGTTPDGLATVTMETGEWEWIARSYDLRAGAYLPDSERLLIVRGNDILLKEPGKEELRPVYSLDPALLFNEGLSIASDGSWLSYSALAAEADVWVMEFEEERAAGSGATE